VVQSWIAERRSDSGLIEPKRWQPQHLKFLLSELVERSTGWRPFEFRNYVIV